MIKHKLNISCPKADPYRNNTLGIHQLAAVTLSPSFLCI